VALTLPVPYGNPLDDWHGRDVRLRLWLVWSWTEESGDFLGVDFWSSGVAHMCCSRHRNGVVVSRTTFRPAIQRLNDYNGNTLTKTDSTGTTNYTWDFENRLSSVTLPGSGGAVSFKYDPFGRRIYKSSSSATSIYAYDGDDLIEETNATGGVVARYTQTTDKIDEPVAMLRSGATSYYQADGLGSVTSLSSAAGALAQTYTFDSFGKQTASSGSITNPFRFAARESDPESGLYYYRARYYDPVAGRFLSEDPLGLNAGINQYEYVHNSPLVRIDPAGTDDYPGIGSVIDAINWARGSYHPVPHIADATAAALSRTPAAADLMGNYKRANCKDGTYCGDFNFKQYFTTFNLVGQTVGGFCAKVKNIGGGHILVDAWNDWGTESGTRWPQLGSENNRTHPSVQDMLLYGYPLQYPSSTLNNRSSGMGATVRTRYVWIRNSPCCGN